MEVDFTLPALELATRWFGSVRLPSDQSLPSILYKVRQDGLKKFEQVTKKGRCRPSCSTDTVHYNIRAQVGSSVYSLFKLCCCNISVFLFYPLLTLVVSIASYLVDAASSHMLVSKIKPCMSKYRPH